ncbi:MAG: hypothetical protein EOP10_13015, partial [Proteobacteria bacterium]
MKKFLALFLFSANSLAYSQNAAAPSSPVASSGGSERAISEAYSVMASDRFLNPGAAKLNTIIGISKLNGVAHPIDFTKVDTKANPALPFLSFDPMKVLTKAETEYRKGDTPRAAYSARRVLHICSECHVFAAKPVWANLVPTGGLTMVEWGEFYKLAARPGDALLQYEKVINSPGLANAQPAIFERSALNIVAMGIESSSNAYTFVDLVSSALQTTTMSKSQKALLSSWRLTGKAWGAERSPITKPYDILMQARQLMTTADGMNRSLPLSGFVHQARAMLALKRVATIGSPDQKARAFYMSGELREAIALEGVY